MATSILALLIACFSLVTVGPQGMDNDVFNSTLSIEEKTKEDRSIIIDIHDIFKRAQYKRSVSPTVYSYAVTDNGTFTFYFTENIGVVTISIIGENSSNSIICDTSSQPYTQVYMSTHLSGFYKIEISGSEYIGSGIVVI